MSRFKELQAREEQLHRTALKESTKTSQTQDLVAQTYRNASKIYLALGDFQTGERHLRRAAEICPQDAEGDSLLAWLYEQQGRTAEAVQALDRLCKKGPNDFNAQMTAASAYARLKEFDEAERAFRRAIELTPLRAGGYAALAHFFLQTQRNLDEAGRLAEKAVQLEPAAEHHFLLSLVRRTRGDTAGAVAAIEAAIALAPQNSGYQQIRRELYSLRQSTAKDPAANHHAGG
jgi:tetratricopeptide (TPR) repeat protein